MSSKKQEKTEDGANNRLIASAVLQNEISQIWNTTSAEIENRFGLTAQSVPAQIEIVEAGHDKLVVSGRTKQVKLKISELVMKGQIPLEGVVARACMASAFPASNICSEAIDDVSSEFARQFLERKDKAAWLEQWAERIPARTVSSNLVYNPSNSWPVLFDMMGGLGLDAIVRDLVAACKYDITLSLEDYLRYFEGRFWKFSVAMSKTSAQIIDRLLQGSDETFESIAKSLGLSPEWVSTKISELRRGRILHRFDAVRFSRIGIRMFHLLLRADVEETNPHRYLSKCPFLYCTNNVISGDWQILATLAVPGNGESISALYDFQHATAKWNFRTYMTEVISSGSKYCLDYYETDTSSWAIPWDLERAQLAKIYDERLSEVFPRIVETKQDRRPHLDDLDIRILNAVWNGLTSVSAIRADLKVGQQRVAERVKRFRRQGIIRTQWEIHNIGLNESAFASSEDPEVGAAIAAWSLRLPRCIISFDLDRRVMVKCSLPLGGSYGFASAIEVLPSVVSVGLLGPPIYGHWGFPMQLWNSCTNCWDSPREKIGEWHESIR